MMIIIIIPQIFDKENLNQAGLVSLRKSSIVLFTWHMTIGCLLDKVNVIILVVADV